MSYGLAGLSGASISSGWSKLPFGAGGQLMPGSFSADGVTHVCRTDSCGAYRWNSTTSQWDQLITTARMPSADIDPTLASPKLVGGSYGVVVAPSDSTRIYLINNATRHGGVISGAGFVYVSTNSGATFVQTATQPATLTFDPNDSANKFLGPKMAVDPANPNVLIIAHPSACYITKDGGATWGLVPNIPTGTSLPCYGICFDPSSAVTLGKTQGIYIYAPGGGLYHSTNGGTSFAAVSGSPTGTPASSIASNGSIASDGVYYLCLTDGTSTTANNHLWRLQSGSWTDVFQSATMPTGLIIGFICTSPFDPATLIAQHYAGPLTLSRDRGATWSPTGAVSSLSNGRTASDIKWLQNTNEGFMNVGGIIMDPIIADKIWFYEGIGVWVADNLASGNISPVMKWRSQSAGIEELIGQQMILPPTGQLLATFSDRLVFPVPVPGVCPANHGPNYTFQLFYGSSIDYAKNNPQVVVAVDQGSNDQSAYSLDGGKTWTVFALPLDHFTGKNGGCIATSTDQIWMWVSTQNGDVYFTVNRGGAWTRISAATWNTGGATGMQDAGGATVTGWNAASYLRRFNVSADTVLPGVFYITNGNAFSAGGGFYKVVISGGVATPTFKSAPISFSNDNVQYASVPGHTDHLFFTCGEGDSSAIYYTTDGGTTLTAIANTGANYCFGFSAPKPGNNYPSVYFVGFLSSVFGVWRGDGNASDWAAGTNTGSTVTWTNLATSLPFNSAAQVCDIVGDLAKWSQIYLLTTNSGGFFYRP